MRQFLRDLGAGRDPLARFANPRSYLAIETVAAVRSRGFVKRQSLALTAGGRLYLKLWCNPEKPPCY